MSISRRAAIGSACAAALFRSPRAAMAGGDQLTLPQLDGPMAVGWEQRLGPGSSTPCLIYYPSAAASTTLVSPPPPAPAGHAADLKRRFGATAATALIQSRGYARAAARARKTLFPVVLFAPGLRLAAYDYRAILECIASHGYVVFAMTPPSGDDYDAVATQFRVIIDSIIAWNADRGDQLGALCDVRSIGCLGHSLGGAAAILAASLDARIRAAANFDGDFGGGSSDARPDQPLLYAISVDPKEPPKSVERRRQIWLRVRSHSRSATEVRLQSFRHFNFLDAALVANLISLDRRQDRFGSVDGSRGITIARSLALGFFDEHLSARRGSLFGRLSTTSEARIVQ